MSTKVNINKATYAALCKQFLEDTVKVSLSTSTAKNTTPLPNGRYRLISDSNCFVKQGGSSVTAATDGTSAYLPANYIDEFWVAASSDGYDGYMAGILVSGTGSLYMTRQGG